MSLNPWENRKADGEELSPELAKLFASYREALPDREAAAQFMPGVWTRIDARRKDTRWFGRVARGFVTASGAICLLIAGALYIPHYSSASLYSTTYVDVVANDGGTDDVAELEMSHQESI